MPLTRTPECDSIDRWLQSRIDRSGIKIESLQSLNTKDFSVFLTVKEHTHTIRFTEGDYRSGDWKRTAEESLNEFLKWAFYPALQKAPPPSRYQGSTKQTS